MYSAIHTHMNRPKSCLLVRFSFSALILCVRFSFLGLFCCPFSYEMMVGGSMFFLLVPAHPGSPRQMAVKRLLCVVAPATIKHRPERLCY